MNLRSQSCGGESSLAAKARQRAAIIAAILAVVAVVLSMLASTPTALAQPIEGADETNITADNNSTANSEDDSAGGDTDSKPDEGLEASPTTNSSPAAVQQVQPEGAAGLDQKDPGLREGGAVKNWAHEYIESIKVFKHGSSVPLTDPPDKETDLFEGTSIYLQFDWSALGKPQAQPNDVLEVELPEWLKLNADVKGPMGDVGTCFGAAHSRKITCTFGERPEGVHIKDGYLKFNAVTVKTESAEKIVFGNVEVDAYYLLTKRHNGPVVVGVVKPDSVGNSVIKGGQYSYEYEFKGRKYVQVIWNIIIPPSKVNEILDNNGAIEITDHLQTVKVVDPDTGKEVELPQYIAPMAKGPFYVLRRSGDSLNNGTWSNNQDEPKCKAGGEFEAKGIKCADKVYGNEKDTLKYFAGRKDENVELSGVTPSTDWKENTTFTARIENPVRDSAYRVSVLSVVPADLLKAFSDGKDGKEPSPRIQNSVEVNGATTVATNGAALYVRSEIGATTYKDSTNFVIKKEVLPDLQGSDIKEFTLRYTVGDKTSECKIAPGSDCRIEKVAPDTKVTIEEPAVAGSKLEWKPGVFTYVNADANKTQVTIEGNKATIAKPVPGERVVLTVTNSYANPTGSLFIKKDVTGLADKNLLAREIEVDYICVPAGQPTENENPVRVKVPTNGEVKEIKDIPVGHECHVQENVSSAEVDKHGINVTYSPEGGKVTIKRDQGEHDSNLVKITNKYSLNTAPIFIRKVVAGERPAGLNDDTEFTVKYRCNNDSADGKVKAEQPAELKLKAKGDPVTGPEFPLDTKCSIVEEKEDEPKFEDFAFTAELGGEITVSNDADASTLVVTNTFKKNEAKLRVTKAVSGDAGTEASTKEFEFEYTCGADTGVLKVKGNGFAETEQTFPVGTECTVKELGVEPDGSAQIHNHILTVTPEVVQQVVVGKDEGAKYTNNYTVKKGKFGVAKKADGENGKAAEQEFVFDYTCGVETGQVRARGNGLVIEAPVELAVGTECTVTERKEAVAIADYDFLTPDDQLTKTVTVREGETAVAEFVNTYARQVNKFKVEKVVKTLGGAVAPATFDFDYKCVLGDDVITGEILGVPANGSGESAEIPTKYVCTVTERDAKVVGTTLVNQIGDPVIIPAKQANATPPVIKVDNLYIALGEFTITKKLVDPDGIAAGKTFDFTYVCTPPADRAGEAPVEGVLTVAAGASATSPKIPAGFNCEIKEVGAEIVDSNLVTTGLDSTLVITKDKQPPLEVTNAYSQWKGALKISKLILGVQPDSKLLKGHEFEAAYKCVKNEKTTNEGSVKVKAGETVTVENIVANSLCTVTEKLDSTKVSSLRFQPELSTTEATAEKITANGGSTEAKLLNSYVELGNFAITKELGGLTGEAAGKDREFQMIAIWTDNGVEVEKEFTIRAGQVYSEFPELPVGTKVVLKERHPGNGVFVQWHTPGFTSDRAGAIVDHHDGTAELTIVADSPVDRPQLVTLTNTGNPPWWWALVPLAILGGGGGSSDGSSNGSSAASSTPAPHSAAPQAPAKGLSAPASLARTGASVLGVVALAGLVTAAGIFLVRRGRNKS